MRVHTVALGENANLYNVLKDWMVNSFIFIYLIRGLASNSYERNTQYIFTKASMSQLQLFVWYKKFYEGFFGFIFFYNFFYEGESTQFIHKYCLWRTGWPILAFFNYLVIESAPSGSRKNANLYYDLKDRIVNSGLFYYLIRGRAPNSYERKKGTLFYEGLDCSIKFICSI